MQGQQVLINCAAADMQNQQVLFSCAAAYDAESAGPD